MVEQTQPQLIFWAKEEGAFRPAKLKMPKNFGGYDLEENIELGEGEISPESLNLVSSVYLGPIGIFEEKLEIIQSKAAFERLGQQRYGTVCGMIMLAKEVAKRKGVPYFSVDVVQTPKDRIWKLTREMPAFAEKEKYLSFLKKNVPEKPLEFVLHPTAQLYVPRE